MRRIILSTGASRLFPFIGLEVARDGLRTTNFQHRSFAVSHSTALHSPAPPSDTDDFVDIDALAGIHNVNPPQRPANESSNVTEPILGVQRESVAEHEVERSRLNIPLEVPRGELRAGRVNSRQAVFSAANETFTDVTLKRASPNTGAEEEKENKAEDNNANTSAELAISGTVTDGDDHQRPPFPSADRTLPYDDEEFAETLLQAEVEGAIDEAWQDTRRAHVEDVKELKSILHTMKVRDICCIDVSSKTASFDYIMMGTCEGSRHIHLAAWAAQEADSLHRIAKIPRKQTDELWEVVPIGRIVLNLFVESLREELTLERKWAVTANMDPLTAANAPVSEGRQVKAHGLWTLTLNLQDLEDFEVDYCKDVLMRQI